MSKVSPFKRVYIANRGEIACRVIQALHELGIEAAVGFSDPDKDAPFVRQADVAIPLDGVKAPETYLDIEKVLAAIEASGSDAVHPGYGFLSERAAFARALQVAGVQLIGPSPECMEQLGDKVQARKTAQAAGVPVVPGTEEPVDPKAGAAAAEAVGYPLLVKAAAGGGGKGMRRVDSSAELAKALEAASREALAAFGDGTLFLERYLERPRHVEVQVLADRHQEVLALFERECSLQRRHQKVLEEGPAPLSDEVRTQLLEASRKLCRAVSYEGAGTVEYLVQGEEFFFLEMNTRIQVEHPVTELLTGIDLVQAQIRVAQGEPLGLTQDDLSCRGHALEARLYAEDPGQGFLPSPGKIHDLVLPQGPGIRVDSGIASGQTITEHYDPMIAKILASGATREEARRRLLRALRQTVVLGPKTNLSFLIEVLEDPEFAAYQTHIHWLEERFQDFREPQRHRGLACLAACLSDEAAVSPGHPPLSSQTGARPTPWETLGGFRL